MEDKNTLKEESKTSTVGIPLELEKPEQVTIDKDKFDAMMKRIERVESAADKARLFHYDAKNKEDFGKSVRLNVWDDGTKKRVVVGRTNMPVDKCEKNPTTGVWHEDQKVTLILEDDERLTMPYSTSVSTSMSQIEADVLSETTDKDGNTTLEVETKEGKKYNIDIKFIN